MDKNIKIERTLTAILAVLVIFFCVFLMETNAFTKLRIVTINNQSSSNERYAREIENSVYDITVNHNETLSQMITSAKYTGKNDFVSELITPANIPLYVSGGKGEEKIQISLIKLDKAMNNSDIPSFLGNKGYRPATVEELLAFSAKYPDMQKKYFITNISPVTIAGYKFIIALTGDSDYRALDVFTAHGVWENRTVIAGVKIVEMKGI
ncbi:MAG: hypothetical protein WCP15_02005 [bacterium]